MKIAMFSDTYFPQETGVAHSVYSFSKTLSRRGHEVHIFAPTGKEHEGSNQHGIKVHEFPSMRFPKYSEFEVAFPMPILKTTRKFMRTDFDVIHAHTMFTMGIRAYFMSKLFRKPLLGSFHTLISKFTKYLTKKFEGSVKRLSWLSSHWYYDRRCDAFTVPTDSTKKILRNYGFENKIYTLPNGIDSEIQKEIKPKQVRDKHEISEEEDVILYFGRLSIEKRVEDLIRAMKCLDEEKVLMICGKGPCKPNLETLAEEVPNRVIFTGYVPEKMKGSYYKAGDVFVFPSVGDTQGIVLLEAMKYGLPIVSVKAQGIVDLVEDGKNGLLAIPENPRDLARKISQVLEGGDFIQEMVDNGEDVLKEHSWEKVTNNLEGIYEEMMTD